jgi:hypothetical protein
MKLNGTWQLDVEATQGQPELSALQREQIDALKTKRVKIELAVDAKEKTAALTITDKEAVTDEADWKLLSEKPEGSVWESSTGFGAKTERITATYLPEARVKLAFADMPFALIMKRAPASGKK